ncbi:hypothetical protein Hdeb2414_s0016g00479601 [Helianthus debilis subsp. tardiflorus]
MMMMFCRRQWMQRRRSSAGFQCAAGAEACAAGAEACAAGFRVLRTRMDVVSAAMLMLVFIRIGDKENRRLKMMNQRFINRKHCSDTML